MNRELTRRGAPTAGLLWLALFLLGAGVSAPAQDARRSNASAWERSVVTIEVARKQYDYYQPWSQGTRRLQKSGLVVGPNEILTTADELFDRTLVRVQKNGRGRWAEAKVAWIDYHANLALVTTPEADFWKALKPAVLGSAAATPDGGLQIVRWREGNLEHRQAEFSQFSVREGQLSPINQPVLEVSSEIQGAGWGEPVVAHSRVVGLLTAQDGRNGYVMPASFIQSILDARRKGEYHGLGYFHFYWQPGKNPASLSRLKLTGEPRGVIVIYVPDRPDGADQVLKPDDIILSIDGFDLDMQGDYTDPEFGHLNLENLAVRHKWAGDPVRMRIWRDAKPMEISYRLPKFEYSNSLVPYAVHDQEPDYVILGGLIFEPLTDSYLQSWGAEWKRNSPFRLHYYNSEEPTKDRPALVLLSQVLPDPYNIGYQDQKFLVLDKVNGRKVSRLTELQEALQSPADGVHILEFVPGDSIRRIVLGAGEAEHEATARVLKRYSIPAAARIRQ
jgi:S1-C subfamily serine protease